MDFVVHLPAFNNSTIVMVIVDRFSKAGHFAMLPTHFTASEAAEVFTTTICKLHLYPGSIISDWDTIFLSSFLRTLYKLKGTKLRMTMAYHLQRKVKQRWSFVPFNNIWGLPCTKTYRVGDDFYTEQSGITKLPLIGLQDIHLFNSFMADPHHLLLHIF